MDTPKPDAVEKIAALAKDAAGLTMHSVTTNGLGEGLPSSIPFAFDHRVGGGIKDLTDVIEKWRLYPTRRRGTATVNTLQSLIDLTNRHKSPHSAVFCATSWPNPSITSVINYHDMVNSTAAEPAAAGAKAQFGDHRILYPFPVTEEFKAWADQDGEAMKQVEFAAFIEERVAELTQATPQEEAEFGQVFQTKMATPADMLVLSRGLEVNVAGSVKQQHRLQSGEAEIVFTEEHLDGAGNKITVPGLFMISVPAFLDGDPVRLPARLRYRVGGGQVTWFYQLYRWKELLRERVVADVATVEVETALPIYEGSPESAR